jgi:hypothetical protein
VDSRIADFEGARDLLRAWSRGIRPDPNLTVSEWPDRHRWLSSCASAEPGRYRTARTPYMREIMDALSPVSPFQRVVFMKAAQVGATEAGNCFVGFVTALDALFADGDISRDAFHTPEGRAPVLVRVVTRHPDEITGFGEARILSETTRLDLRVAEVPAPRPGDRIEIDGDAFLIQGEPVRDRERLVWTVDLRPA